MPASWDKDGNVKHILLACRKEKEYFIQDSNQSHKLALHLRKKVSVKAQQIEHSEPGVWVQVIDFELLK